MTESPTFTPSEPAGSPPAGRTPPMPPRVLLFHLVAQVVVHFALPGPRLWDVMARSAGVVVALAGAALVIGVARTFDRRGTTIKPFQQSDQLVTDGPFRLSRNPIYLGMTCVLIGFALFLGTLAPMLVVPVFPWWITRNVIVHEERMLEDRFGDAYRSYRQRVRRWL